MKVIFLDLDGTLNNLETFQEYEKRDTSDYPIDEDMLLRLKRIVDATDAKIVLSASARGGWSKKIENCYGKMKELSEKLLDLNMEIYDKTDYIDGNREKEISAWIALHDVSSFIILDDETSFLKKFWNNGLIKLNTLPYGQMVRDMRECTGLQDEHVKIAIEMLGKEAD